MARKSRKNAADGITSAVSSAGKVPSSQQYATAIYARLSVENSGKDDKGAAIETQVEVCREYVKSCPYLSLTDTYVDNGYTGTVFSRPEFNRLMDDVRSGKIKAIVVRDLSRFGRNYIETGTYLERIFPKLEVRFIAVKEQYDSFAADGSNESLMVPLQNMINDLYSKDISRKVSAALKVQREQGTYTLHQVAYGYKWNEDGSNIVPFYPYASYVKQMYAWFLEGVSLHEIARRLNAADIPTWFVLNERREGTQWVSTTVRIILANPVYAGDKAFGRSISAIYKGIKNQRVDAARWTVTKDDHEALVSRDHYEAVQKRMKENECQYHTVRRENAREREKVINILEGKTFCPDCGGKLHMAKRKWKNGTYAGFYECSRYRTSDYKNCSQHYMSQKVLHEKILEAIRLQAKTAVDYEKMISRLRDSEAAMDIRVQLNAQIQSLTLRIKGLSNKRSRLYEDFVDGILDEAEYLFAKDSYDSDFEKLNRELDEAVLRRNEFLESLDSDNKWITLMKSVSTAGTLTKELVDEAIARVEVNEDKSVIITMKYHEIYEAGLRHIEEIKTKEAKKNV